MRVLVAEDDPVISLGLCERLRSLGHEPIGPAADGAQAIALAHQSSADVYLFDIDPTVFLGLGQSGFPEQHLNRLQGGIARASVQEAAADPESAVQHPALRHQIEWHRDRRCRNPLPPEQRGHLPM